MHAVECLPFRRWLLDLPRQLLMYNEDTKQTQMLSMMQVMAVSTL